MMKKRNYRPIIELVEASSAHGYSNIAKSKRKCQKYMWTIFTLVSTFGCIWFTINSIIEYSSFSVFTNIQYVFEQPSQFPTVTFCSFNDIFKKNNLSDLIDSCFFSYGDNCQKDPYNNFEPFYSGNYGNCYKFNSGFNYYGEKTKIRNSILGGRDDSLRLRLKLPEGLVLWIHNQSYQPVIDFYNNHNSNMNYASGGTLTQLTIDKTIENKLGVPYNDCLNDVRSFRKNKTLVDFILRNNKSYSQIKCFDYCYELYYYNTNPCNCTASSFDKGWDYCFVNDSNNKADCTINYKNNFYTETILEKCADYCPLECDSINYHVTVDSLKSNVNFTYIIVYYRSLKFLYINQFPAITLVDLISNIGGILGLFIGISFLSFIELVEIFTEFIFILRENKYVHQR